MISYYQHVLLSLRELDSSLREAGRMAAIVTVGLSLVVVEMGLADTTTTFSYGLTTKKKRRRTVLYGDDDV